MISGGFRQVSDEGGALAGDALDREGASKLLDDAARDTEAEAEPGVPPVGHRALEPLEDPLVMLGGHADAVVGHLEARSLVVPLDDDLESVFRYLVGAS